MKRLISLLLIIFTLTSLAACSDKNGASATRMAKVINSMEYSLYLNVHGELGDRYSDITYEKTGVFSILYDEYNSTVRYYVWGYSDETLCCDWQWEFVPADPSELPPIGSYVTVKGKLVRDSDALDNFRMENATVKTITEYTAAKGKYDTTTMSSTLATVQLQNFMGYANVFRGEEITVYGRVGSGNILKHPYYDNSWEIDLEYEKKLPAIGEYVTVTGLFDGDGYHNAKINVTSLKAEKV